MSKSKLLHAVIEVVPQATGNQLRLRHLLEIGFFQQLLWHWKLTRQNKQATHPDAARAASRIRAPVIIDPGALNSWLYQAGSGPLPELSRAQSMVFLTERQSERIPEEAVCV